MDREPGGLQSMGHKEVDMTEVTAHTKLSMVFPWSITLGQDLITG